MSVNTSKNNPNPQQPSQPALMNRIDKLIKQVSKTAEKNNQRRSRESKELKSMKAVRSQQDQKPVSDKLHKSQRLKQLKYKDSKPSDIYTFSEILQDDQDSQAETKSLSISSQYSKKITKRIEQLQLIMESRNKIPKIPAQKEQKQKKEQKEKKEKDIQQFNFEKQIKNKLSQSQENNRLFKKLKPQNQSSVLNTTPKSNLEIQQVQVKPQQQPGQNSFQSDFMKLQKDNQQNAQKQPLGIASIKNNPKFSGKIVKNQEKLQLKQLQNQNDSTKKLKNNITENNQLQSQQISKILNPPSQKNTNFELWKQKRSKSACKNTGVLKQIYRKPPLQNQNQSPPQANRVNYLNNIDMNQKSTPKQTLEQRQKSISERVRQSIKNINNSIENQQKSPYSSFNRQNNVMFSPRYQFNAPNAMQPIQPIQPVQPVQISPYQQKPRRITLQKKQYYQNMIKDQQNIQNLQQAQKQMQPQLLKQIKQVKYQSPVKGQSQIKIQQPKQQVMYQSPIKGQSQTKIQPQPVNNLKPVKDQNNTKLKPVQYSQSTPKIQSQYQTPRTPRLQQPPQQNTKKLQINHLQQVCHTQPIKRDNIPKLKLQQQMHQQSQIIRQIVQTVSQSPIKQQVVYQSPVKRQNIPKLQLQLQQRPYQSQIVLQQNQSGSNQLNNQQILLQHKNYSTHNSLINKNYSHIRQQPRQQLSYQPSPIKQSNRPTTYSQYQNLPRSNQLNNQQNLQQNSQQNLQQNMQVQRHNLQTQDLDRSRERQFQRQKENYRDRGEKVDRGKQGRDLSNNRKRQFSSSQQLCNKIDRIANILKSRRSKTPIRRKPLFIQESNISQINKEINQRSIQVLRQCSPQQRCMSPFTLSPFISPRLDFSHPAGFVSAYQSQISSPRDNHHQMQDFVKHSLVKKRLSRQSSLKRVQFIDDRINHLINNSNQVLINSQSQQQFSNAKDISKFRLPTFGSPEETQRRQNQYSLFMEQQNQMQQNISSIFQNQKEIYDQMQLSRDVREQQQENQYQNHHQHQHQSYQNSQNKYHNKQNKNNNDNNHTDKQDKQQKKKKQTRFTETVINTRPSDLAEVRQSEQTDVRDVRIPQHNVRNTENLVEQEARAINQERGERVERDEREEREEIEERETNQNSLQGSFHNQEQELYQDKVYWLKLLKEVYELLIKDIPSLTSQEFRQQIKDLIPNEFTQKYPNGCSISCDDIINCLKKLESNRQFKYLDMINSVISLSKK